MKLKTKGKGYVFRGQTNDGKEEIDHFSNIHKMKEVKAYVIFVMRNTSLEICRKKAHMLSMQDEEY